MLEVYSRFIFVKRSCSIFFTGLGLFIRFSVMLDVPIKLSIKCSFFDEFCFRIIQYFYMTAWILSLLNLKLYGFVDTNRSENCPIGAANILIVVDRIKHFFLKGL